MSRSLRVFQVDAFTDRPFTGNPAGVVLEAGQLADAEMQAIARELGQGDTAFVLPADGPDHDLRLRFFTPRSEAGFVGHATLATHAVLAALGEPEQPRQKQRTGIVTVTREAQAGAPRFAFAQPPPRLQGPLPEALLARVLSGLGLAPAELDPRLPVTVAGEASTRALIALRDPARLATLAADQAALGACSAAGAPPGFFVYAVREAAGVLGTEARMFCPALGIAEDPVSGNAHAMLAHQLWACGLLDRAGPRTRFAGLQGQHMGRAGRVDVEVESSGGMPHTVRIAGAACIVYEARLYLPGAWAAGTRAPARPAAR